MLTWGRGSRPKDPPLIDAAFLARLSDHIGADVLRELLSDGLIEMTDRLERLGEEALAGRRAHLLALGHDIAGLAGHIGLSALSRAAVEMNRTARADPVLSLTDLAGPVLDAGDEALDALRDRIGATAPDAPEREPADPR